MTKLTYCGYWLGLSGSACYEGLRRRSELAENLDILTNAINAALPDLTQLERRIAAHFLARPDAIIAETNTVIAKTLDLSPMTLTRFFRKLGFADTADARNQVKKARYGPGSVRIDQRFADSSTRLASQNTDESLALCRAAVSAAFAIRESEVWTKIVELVSSSDAVHVTGFQTMFYMADGFARRLSYLRDRVQLIDGIDGVYAGLMPGNDDRNVLIMMDVFRYGAHAPQLAKLARERGIEVVVIADEFCDWATDITPYVLRYPGETNFFLAMPQGITTALNLLLQDVIAKLGSDAGQRIKKLSEAQDYFGLFLD